MNHELFSFKTRFWTTFLEFSTICMKFCQLPYFNPILTRFENFSGTFQRLLGTIFWMFYQFLNNFSGIFDLFYEILTDFYNLLNSFEQDLSNFYEHLKAFYNISKDSCSFEQILKVLSNFQIILNGIFYNFWGRGERGRVNDLYEI